jgi:hypothetical protein
MKVVNSGVDPTLFIQLVRNIFLKYIVLIMGSSLNSLREGSLSIFFDFSSMNFKMTPFSLDSIGPPSSRSHWLFPCFFDDINIQQDHVVDHDLSSNVL